MLFFKEQLEIITSLKYNIYITLYCYKVYKSSFVMNQNKTKEV